MALSTTVNSQITDAVTQANVKVIADAPAIAIGNLYQMISSSLGLSAQNAVMAQQQSNIIHQAATTQGVNLLYAVDTEAVADATEKVSRADIPADLVNVLGVLKGLN
ncbi:MAG: RebB family R body protein, partial [Alphaproteobacteria bacterium]